MFITTPFFAKTQSQLFSALRDARKYFEMLAGKLRLSVGETARLKVQQNYAVFHLNYPANVVGEVGNTMAIPFTFYLAIPCI